MIDYIIIGIIAFSIIVSLLRGFVREVMSLASWVVAFIVARDVYKRQGTIGVPVPNTDIKIIKDDGSEAQLGEAGELWVKGDQVMLGYWQRPEACLLYTSRCV